MKEKKVNYNGLWKILIDKNMNKEDLAKKANISKGTIAKMGRGEFVSMEILYKVGHALGIDFCDMISLYFPNRMTEK